VSAGVRLPLAEARAVADELVALLAPACERIEIAGSIRRGRPDVGDIELVAVPRITIEATQGLWGNGETERVNELDELADRELLRVSVEIKRADGSIEHQRRWGPRYKASLFRGIPVDLFSTTPASFGLIYLIRTGPAAFSQRLVTDARRRDLHVAEGQLHRGSLGCGAYVCEVIPTPGERDVFGAMDLPWIAPEARA
jgi:DNA polymerase/3'-5' exonuclease PolX